MTQQLWKLQRLLISINKRLRIPDEITVHKKQDQPQTLRLHIVASLLLLKMVSATFHYIVAVIVTSNLSRI